jgi:hypothetical protein
MTTGSGESIREVDQVKKVVIIHLNGSQHRHYVFCATILWRTN